MTRLVLWQKEWLEAARTYKLLLIPVIFILMGVAQPITVHFMPQILEKAALPEGAVIQIPTPPPPEIVGTIIDQYNQIGLFVIILTVMGSIAREIEQGQTGLLLTLKVSRARYLVTKWFTYSIIALCATLIGFLGTAYYTTVLFGSLHWGHVLTSALVYSLYPIYVVSVTLMFSAMFTSQLAAAGGALVTVMVSSLVSLFGKGVVRWLPVQVAGMAKMLLSGTTVQIAQGIAVACTWIGLALLVTYLVLRKREL